MEVLFFKTLMIFTATVGMLYNIAQNAHRTCQDWSGGLRRRLR